MVTKFPKEKGRGEKVFHLRITETTLKIDSLKAAFWKWLTRADSVVTLLSRFAKLFFEDLTRDFVVEQCRKGKLICFSLFLSSFFSSFPPPSLPPCAHPSSLSISFFFSKKRKKKEKLINKLMKRVLVDPTSVIRWSWRLPVGTCPQLTGVPSWGALPVPLQKLALLFVWPLGHNLCCLASDLFNDLTFGESTHNYVYIKMLIF